MSDTDLSSPKSDPKDLPPPIMTPSSPTLRHDYATFEVPSPLRASILLLALVLVIAINIAIGNSTIVGQPMLYQYEVVPISLFSYSEQIFSFVVKMLPGACINIWFQQVFWAFGLQKSLHWKQMLLWAPVGILAMVAIDKLIDVAREVVGVSRLGILGLWRCQQGVPELRRCSDLM